MARRRLEARAAEHGDLAAAVVEPPLGLQLAGGLGYALAAHAWWQD